MTHSPYEIPAEGGYIRKADDVHRQVMNAMVNIMDDAVGNLSAALEARGMAADTLLLFTADNGGVYHGNQKGNNHPLRGQKTSSWEGGVRATAFLWGGANVLPHGVRGTTCGAFIHVADWYVTLTKLVGVSSADRQAGVPDVDGVDQWPVLMTPNAGAADSVRDEVPLAFCPLTPGKRGSDNCCPTAEAGGWKPNGTALAPSEWRNGALIQRHGQRWYKMVWGEQFGFGVHAPKLWPDGTVLPTNDTGCPSGCLFELLSDPTESNDLAHTPDGTRILAQLIARQQQIGLTVHQTNYSDVDDDARCISVPQMLERYSGFLGPRCGL